MDIVNLYITQIKEETKKARPKLIIAAAIIIVFALSLLFIPIGDSSETTIWLLRGVVGFMVLIGIAIVILAIRPVDRFPPPIVKILQQSPEKIVWVYAVNRTQYGKTIESYLIFATIDGKKIRGPIPDKTISSKFEIGNILNMLPNVTIGYKADYEMTYQKNPSQLAKQ